MANFPGRLSMLTMNDSNRLVGRSGAALVLGVALVLAGPVPTCRGQGTAEDAAKFDDAISLARGKLANALAEYGAKFGTAFASEKAEDLAQMKVAYVNNVLLVRRLRADWKATKVLNSRTGKDLHAAFARFLRQQETFLQTGGLEFIQIAEDKTLTREKKRARIEKIIQRNKKLEEEEADKLVKARQAFAKEHNLKPE
jgi:hypothetical protein